MLAAADVLIRQVQVINKNGQVMSVVVWRCGPDIMFAETMDGLFDADRRIAAPQWLIDQLDALPEDRRFTYDGSPYGKAASSGKGATKNLESLGLEDEPTKVDADLPGFQEA